MSSIVETRKYTRILYRFFYIFLHILTVSSNYVNTHLSVKLHLGYSMASLPKKSIEYQNQLYFFSIDFNTLKRLYINYQKLSPTTKVDNGHIPLGVTVNRFKHNIFFVNINP